MQQVEVNQKKETHSNIPHNIEAEQSLIGSVLVNNEILDEISNIVNASKFYDPVHVKIFETIENLNKACPNHLGDWYFTGEYPTFGGNKVANRAFMNYCDGIKSRAY